jgi:hypothetical protein
VLTFSGGLSNQPEKQDDPECTLAEPSVQDIARWSSQGSALLNHVVPFDQEAFNRLIAREFNDLRTCFGEAEDGNFRLHMDKWGEMRTILECALDLDRMLTNSKALFTIGWSSDLPGSEGKLLYNDGVMDALAHNPPLSEQSPVQFFTSPILIKCGNADGQNYDQTVVLIKASVVCF